MGNSVQVLNASYEPLNHVDWTKAVKLVLAEKAVIEEADETRVIRHRNGSMPWPRVIRLLRYVRIPFSYGEVPWTKAGVLKRDGRICCYCGKRGDTVEHIMPTSRGGGARDWMNTAACCLRCQARKADKTLEEAGMRLIYELSVPMQFTRARGGSKRRARRHGT